LAFGRAEVPNLITLSRLLGLATVDCLTAALALWFLLPVDLAFASFLPVFLVALGAGLVSGSPAGLGAFEIALFALLPGVAEADLLAGVLAWRVIYYALPALVGASVALAAAPEVQAPTNRLVPPPDDITEAGLVAQQEFSPHGQGFIAGRTRHALVALSAVADHARFSAAAREEARWPVLYKAGGRQAAVARRAGHKVLPLAREAWLAPQEFHLDQPTRASLRRKLRRAEAGGVSAGIEAALDWSLLAQVNAAWVKARGGEHGFSMGRFDPAYLAGQKLVVARAAGRIVGFASFHRSNIKGDEVWVLDLLRPDPSAPEGTAHLMITSAIMAARDLGVARLSLAAVPIGSHDGEQGLVAGLGRRLAPKAVQGLYQFKKSFAPRWQPLYVTGPSWIALAVAGLEIWRRVHRPAPLANMRWGPRCDAEYEFASSRWPWQREGKKAA
jgi:phosphatidylglycerol lysyltransferase